MRSQMAMISLHRRSSIACPLSVYVWVFRFRFRCLIIFFVFVCLFNYECARTSHQRLPNPPPQTPQIPPTTFRAKVRRHARLSQHHRHSLRSPLRHPPRTTLPPIRSKTTATRIRSTSRTRLMTTMTTQLPVNCIQL